MIKLYQRPHDLPRILHALGERAGPGGAGQLRGEASLPVGLCHVAGQLPTKLACAPRPNRPAPATRIG